MKRMLQSSYGVDAVREIKVNGKEGFSDGVYHYFTILMTNKEIIHMEQATLAHFLLEMGYEQTACPIQNNYGEWITRHNDHHYIVYRVLALQTTSVLNHGQELAMFHDRNTAYRFQPQAISSYGQWKSLWIQKLDAFEHTIKEEAVQYSTSFYRKLMNIMPYIIGLSENAIQYMQESEAEMRHDESDQGTIVFYRYNYNLTKEIIWADDLVYDHPARDLAEQIRAYFLQTDLDVRYVQEFIRDYTAVRPLTIFTIRLLYARLIFPIHLFDMMEREISKDEDVVSADSFIQMLQQQKNYEDKLRQFHEIIEVDIHRLQIPVLQWL
ncbi:hypothetical protein ACLIBG_06885 [Virgibacillus sp. W0181]|uniref:hypothetical protein n=1 Tax=Virgibacillus sp. W0181 TaxID=3391581 RepID=UPI003F48D733